jgi:hypothetical protein
MKKMISPPIALAVAALWSLPAAAGDIPPPSVYVAPGGVYIGSAQVYVGPGNGNGGQAYAVPGPAYVPGYGPPIYAPGYAAPAPAYVPTYGPAPVYRAPLPVYRARPTAGPYVSPYVDYAPRPPVVVPYNGGNGCVAAYGRVICE